MSEAALKALKQADWLRAPAVQKTFSILDGDQGRTKAVGGIVRNTLLGEPAGDVDMATELLPDELMARAEAAGVKHVPTGIEHGTVTLVFDDQNIEVTSLRKDIKTDGRHAIVEFGGDWTSDAERRDFTFNALYAGPDGELLDPLDGLDDCLKREVRFIGDAKERIKEDYLRIMRFYRFFAFYGAGRPNADGLKASVALKKGLDSLSPERVWQELKKLLSANDPSRALLWMRTTGVLTQIVPECEKWGIDAIHGLVDAEDGLGWQKDPLLRLKSILPPMPEKLSELAKRLRFSNRETDDLLQWAMVSDLKPEMSAQELNLNLYFGSPDAIVATLRLMSASARQKSAEGVEAVKLTSQLLALLKKAEQWQKPDFPLSGKDLLANGFEAGPKMGETLKALEQQWARDGFKATKEELLAELPK
jgi:poly(A) polymerase